ncbi:MAG: tRNA (adenosine(37)-N6)-threonylcarbamoyltransferase complex ATPase subunit type 1 TsaE [Parachlamydiales bacterium]|jgi:tRNA threonylcarbamoyladenosine biosynthesis protein TsaE
MAKIKKIITNSFIETINIGIELGKKLPKGSVIAFFGSLGAGKTTLTKGIVEGVTSSKNIEVISPTFTYLNIYNPKHPIYHFDLYRIKNKNHFYAMGFEEYFSSEGICLIEWAENIKEILPKNTIIIKLKHICENQREISIINQNNLEL